MSPSALQLALAALPVVAGLPALAAQEDEPRPVPAELWGLELGVRDVERAARFYVELLGFERLSAPSPAPAALVLRLEELHLVLVRSTAPVVPDEAARCYPNFSVGDLGSTAERALAAGGSVETTGVRATAVGSALEVRDPDGHPLHVIDHPWDERGPDDPPALFNVGLRVLEVAPFEPWLARLGIPVGNRAYLPETLVMEPRGAAQLVLHPRSTQVAAPDRDGGRLILVSREPVPDAGLLPGFERVVPGLGGGDRYLLRGPSGIVAVLHAEPPLAE